VNKAVGKAKHFTVMGLYNILPLNHLRYLKLWTPHHTVKRKPS